MQYIFLSQDFFNDYPLSKFPEIEEKSDRPYALIVIKIASHNFAILLRTKVAHKWKFPYLDFTPTKKSAIMILTNIRKAGEKVVNEKMAVFKGYLRSLMRQLKLLKKAIDEKNIEEAEKIINELIEDTQNNIED